MARRGTQKPSEREAEVIRLLTHAVDCCNPDCKFCDRIQRDLEDGAQYFAATDMMSRWETLDGALDALIRQASTLTDILESVPLSFGAKKSGIGLIHGLQLAKRILNEPLTRGTRVLAAQANPAKLRQKRAVTRETLILVAEIRPS